MGPPQPPSLELPKPPLDLHAVRKGSQVTLTWTIPEKTTDRLIIHSVGATRICRTTEAMLTECGTPVGQASAQPHASAGASSKQKTTASYVDTLPEQMQTENASAFATYAIEVLNVEGHGAGLSNEARVPLIRTPPAPIDFTARVAGQGIVLNWSNSLKSAPAAASERFIYRVYRRPEDNRQQTLVGELPPRNDRSLTLTDSAFEWEKTYEYRVETVTIVVGEDKKELHIEGDDSPEVKVFAHDVFPPAIPSGVQAVFSGPGQQTFIDLIWAPVTDVDLDGYNVYRHEAGSTPVKLNAAPLKTPAYRDAAVVSGKNYFYSVSAIDVRGNESAHSEETSESVP